MQTETLVQIQFGDSLSLAWASEDQMTILKEYIGRLGSHMPKCLHRVLHGEIADQRWREAGKVKIINGFYVNISSKCKSSKCKPEGLSKCEFIPGLWDLFNEMKVLKR